MGTCFGAPSRSHHGAYRDPYYTSSYGNYRGGSSYPGEYPVDYYHGHGSSIHDGPSYGPSYSSSYGSSYGPSYYPEDDPYYDRPYMYPETLVYSREGLHYAHPVPAVPVPPYRSEYY